LLKPERNQGHGRMRRHRQIITAGLLMLAIASVTPTVASAGPLLSGYGGPGQGNQAILGSALLGGPSAGGGSGGHNGSSGRGSGASGSLGGAAGGQSGAGAGAASAGSAASAGGVGAAGGAHAASANRGKHGTGAVRGASGAGRVSSAHPSSLTASSGSVSGSQTLGLSGADLLYILLAFGVLVFAGLLTKRLAREPG
jgi:hypothetical protein